MSKSLNPVRRIRDIRSPLSTPAGVRRTRNILTSTAVMLLVGSAASIAVGWTRRSEALLFAGLGAAILALLLSMSLTYVERVTPG